MKKKVAGKLLAWICCLLVAGPAAAGEVDVLLEKLVEKGVLSQAEANIVKEETRQQVSKEVAQSQSYAVPSWVQSIKMSGDLRLRYQNEKLANGSNSRNRGRTRFRLGMEAKPSKQFLMSAGIASGGTDPRSTNVTWENTFERPDVRLDWAFVEYEPYAWLKTAGGKIKFPNYLVQTTDMLWDTDINPNGGSAHLEHELIPGLDGFLNGGAWIIDENGAVKRVDPFLGYIQGGLSGTSGKFDAMIAGTYYNFNGVKGLDLDNELNTNSQVAGAADGVLKYDYDSVAASVLLGSRQLFDGLPFMMDERITLFGDFIYNPDPDTQNKGWASGVQFGNEKIDEFGKWNLKYQYVWLQKDAWLDTFPDSDRYGGRTDVKAHEAVFQLGLAKNIYASIDYYTAQRIKAAKNEEHIVQGDLNIKF